MDIEVGTETERATVSRPRRMFTSKQMGDACEMLVAAELTLAGIPALKVPDNWPHYDVIAQPREGAAKRISVKSRTYTRGQAYVGYNEGDQFDWLAIVILSPDDASARTVYMVPRSTADRLARRDSPTAKTAQQRYYRIDEVERLFGAYRGNFSLAVTDPELTAADAAKAAGLPPPTER